MRIQMGVIFVIGVNELVFFAQEETRKDDDNDGLGHVDNDVQLEDGPSKLELKCVLQMATPEMAEDSGVTEEMIAC